MLTRERFLEIYSYRNQYVRDLAWALASPPLMRPVDTGCRWFDTDWYQQVYKESVDWLQQLDQDQTALAGIIEAEKDQRLGRYFELLWTFWFEHSDRFNIIGRNIQIEHQGRTCGELDMVVEERATGRTIHIELAVKFYLGVGDTRKLANWYGINKRDRLDIKLDALRNRQSVLSRQPHVQQALADRGIHIDSCAVILKGRLFYPGKNSDHAAAPLESNPDHLKSYWLSRHELDQLDGLDYMPQLRRGWLAGSRQQQGQVLYTDDDIRLAVYAGELDLPLYLTGYRKLQENLRLFVVPDNWSTML